MPNDYQQLPSEALSDTGLRYIYSDYLQSFHWDYYCTVTFRKSWRDGIYAGQSVWETLNADCGAKRAFLAVEKHRYPEKRVHIHGLVADYVQGGRSSLLLPWDVWDRLFSRFGRSTVETINSPGDVAEYCSKYVVKAMSDYGFYGAPLFWEK